MAAFTPRTLVNSIFPASPLAAIPKPRLLNRGADSICISCLVSNSLFVNFKLSVCGKAVNDVAVTERVPEIPVEFCKDALFVTVRLENWPVCATVEPLPPPDDVESLDTTPASKSSVDEVKNLHSPLYFLAKNNPSPSTQHHCSSPSLPTPVPGFPWNTSLLAPAK